MSATKNRRNKRKKQQKEQKKERKNKINKAQKDRRERQNKGEKETFPIFLSGANLVDEDIIAVEDVRECVLRGVDFVKSVIVDVSDDHLIVRYAAQS